MKSMDARLRRGLFLAVAIATVATTGASAATINVTTTADDAVIGNCSLREAVASANTDSAVDACLPGSGPDTINVPAGTYTLTGAANDNANASGDLDIQNTPVVPSDEEGDLTILGAGDGAGGTIIDANDVDRAIDVQDAAGDAIDFAIDDVKIVDGSVTGVNDDGGGILMRESAGNLTVRRVTIDSSQATGRSATALGRDGA